MAGAIIIDGKWAMENALKRYKRSATQLERKGKARAHQIKLSKVKVQLK